MNVINEKGGTIMAPLFSIYINVVIRKASYIISDRVNLRKKK